MLENDDSVLALRISHGVCYDAWVNEAEEQSIEPRRMQVDFTGSLLRPRSFR
jgi:hypothetical protein